MTPLRRRAVTAVALVSLGMQVAALGLLVPASAAQTLEPHRLCQYLFELAGIFSTYYDACPVLKAPDEGTKLSRLRLCAITERVMSDGLRVLGMPVLERM